MSFFAFSLFFVAHLLVAVHAYVKVVFPLFISRSIKTPVNPSLDFRVLLLATFLSGCRRSVPFRFARGALPWGQRNPGKKAPNLLYYEIESAKEIPWVDKAVGSFTAWQLYRFLRLMTRFVFANLLMRQRGDKKGLRFQLTPKNRGPPPPTFPISLKFSRNNFSANFLAKC